MSGQRSIIRGAPQRVVLCVPGGVDPARCFRCPRPPCAFNNALPFTVVFSSAPFLSPKVCVFVAVGVLQPTNCCPQSDTSTLHVYQVHSRSRPGRRRIGIQLRTAQQHAFAVAPLCHQLAQDGCGEEGLLLHHLPSWRWHWCDLARRFPNCKHLFTVPAPMLQNLV